MRKIKMSILIIVAPISGVIRMIAPYMNSVTKMIDIEIDIEQEEVIKDVVKPMEDVFGTLGRGGVLKTSDQQLQKLGLTNAMVLTLILCHSEIGIY